jgi:hypothetical protein
MPSTINTSQDPDYFGPVGHEKKFHQTHFGVIKERGGNERVKVKTADGFTFMSLELAEELGMEIIPKKVKRGISRNQLNPKHS